jgi:F-type H+-transporting ATPase subunit delta
MASAVAEAFDEMVEERQGIVRAHATTAVPLATGDRQALSERIAQLTGQQVVLDTEVDQAILGGMVVLIGDRLIDGSTRSRLRALRNSMVSGRA